MKAKIKCQTCNQILGEIEKTVIDEVDQEQYKIMCDCDQGHQNVILEIIDSE